MKPQSSLVSKRESASWRARDWPCPKGSKRNRTGRLSDSRLQRRPDKRSGSEVTDTTCNQARATKRNSPLWGNLPNTVFKGGGGGGRWEHLVLFHCLPGTSGLKLAGNNRDGPEMGLGPCPHLAHELS